MFEQKREWSLRLERQVWLTLTTGNSNGKMWTWQVEMAAAAGATAEAAPVEQRAKNYARAVYPVPQ